MVGTTKPERCVDGTVINHRHTSVPSSFYASKTTIGFLCLSLKTVDKICHPEKRSDEGPPIELHDVGDCTIFDFKVLRSILYVAQSSNSIGGPSPASLRSAESG